MEKYNFNVEKVKNDLIQWIRDWFEENGKFCRAIIGISGGKDSTVVAALCVEALGRDRVIGVLMPNGEQKDISDSHKVCEFLGIRNFTINIKDSVDSILSQMEKSGIVITNQTRTNLPARVRMSTLYAVSQSNIGRVSNNCNLSEDVMGYSTKYGDAAGDFSPLSGLTTLEVVAIGDSLGLPYELTHKTPIDGLNTNEDGSYVTDEQSMGVTYEEIHRYVRDTDSLPVEVKNKISEQQQKNLFKLKPIPKFTPKHSDLFN